MQNHALGFRAILPVFALVGAWVSASAEKVLTLETPHYRVAYEKKHQDLAQEILKVAESVWPTLAKAYDSYDRYQRIDIKITDDGDDANGFAIYNFSRVEIFAPHMDWVMRNRHGWIRNVVTHELAHVFSLRRAAYLSPVDAVELYGMTYNYADRINYSFHIPWIPLVAPTWYVEGIAQFEAYMNGNDSWDSQRDMVVRDAYLTGTLPTLDFIETFEYDEDWTQAERCYNTGYAFLLYLKERFGADKVRDLARPKPLANFSYSVRKAFGRDLTDLFEDFKRSLADRYADFKEMATDSLADKDMVGGFQQNLAFSKNGRYMAWLGNAENRRVPMNWIYWKDLGTGKVVQSEKPVDRPASAPAPVDPAPSPAPAPEPDPDGFMAGAAPGGAIAALARPRYANPALALGRGFGAIPGAPSLPRSSASGYLREKEALPETQRSQEFGANGLEFNHDNTRLLTTRQDPDARYTDIWEYEFRARKSEAAKWHRLTWEERAIYPSYHPSKNIIVYSRKKGGSSNLTVLDSTGRNWQLTNFTNGEQVYNPRFTPKGDSIYFTLGLLDKEAIVSVNADAPRFDPFRILKDSTDFPDSLSLSGSEKLTFITPLRQGAYRDIRFLNDTLLWSSNAEDSVYSVYNVYARLPGDSSIYRATQVAGQATEPLVRDGTLYYQGYRRQQFRIFRAPFALSPTGGVLAAPRDSVPQMKAKQDNFAKLDYPRAFETGEYSGIKAALDLTPFLSVQPVFISGTRSYSDIALGLNATFGEAYGGWSQSISGAVTKRTTLDAPMNYQFQYAGFLSSSPIRHTRYDWPVNLYYSLYHDQVQSNTVSVETGGVRQGADTVSFYDRQAFYSTYSRNSASATLPLPGNFVAGGSYFAQHLTLEYARTATATNVSTGEVQPLLVQPRTTFYRDAQQHRHFAANLGWAWSKGMLGTYLPTGGGVWAYAHKYWAAYESDFLNLDTASLITLSQQGRAAPVAVLVQSRFDPWSVDGGVGGIYSLGRHLSLFANAEAGAFLNRFPTDQAPAHLTFNSSANAYDTLTTARPPGGLWVLSYRLGYYRMSGYPYNFEYRGRDIMEGSSFAFGQYGFQIPIKMGAFLPGWPVTSLKQVLFTGMGEWGSTLLAPPDGIYRSLERGEHNLLLDFGARLSFNFHLYHQLPFSVFVQGFIPYNKLKKENLYWFDYAHTGAPNADGTPSAQQLANDPADRAHYIRQVKDPRFYLGFNLGIF